jgi:sugar phosphate isomerase/epimerase
MIHLLDSKKMNKQMNKGKQFTRRSFIGSTAALAALAAIPGGLASCTGKVAEKGSRFGGVQIGAISYSYRSMPDSAENMLGYLLASGISSVELMGNTIESYAGIPVIEIPSYPRGTELTDEQQAELMEARALQTEEHRKWRLSVPLENFAGLKKMYNDAGVNIDIAKLGNPRWSDEEIDYAFNVARTLGARGITTEISVEAAQRMAPFAEKHKLFVIFHNHGQPGLPGFSFEEYLTYSPYLKLNLDVGHYFGATGLHPNMVIERLHDRIASLHIKDKTGPDANPADTNMPFGEGDTPLADILLLLKEKGWPITADIELEYPIPEGSDAVKEVAKCVEYCRAILEG